MISVDGKKDKGSRQGLAIVIGAQLEAINISVI